MISNNQSIELDIYTSSTLERILHDIKHSRSGYASRIVPLPSLPLLPLLPSMPSMPSITATTNQQLTSLYESSDFTTGTCMQDYLHSHFTPNIETHLYSVSTPPVFQRFLNSSINPFHSMPLTVSHIHNITYQSSRFSNPSTNILEDTMEWNGAECQNIYSVLIIGT